MCQGKMFCTLPIQLIFLEDKVKYDDLKYMNSNIHIFVSHLLNYPFSLHFFETMWKGVYLHWISIHRNDSSRLCCNINKSRWDFCVSNDEINYLELSLSRYQAIQIKEMITKLTPSLLQCGTVITRSIFSQIFTIDTTPHSSPLKAR